MGIGFGAGQRFVGQRMIGGIGRCGLEADKVEHMDRGIARQRLESVELGAFRVDMLVGHGRNSLRLIRQASALQGVVDYGNVKEGNTTAIAWPGCSCRTLPDSLYRSVPPDFILAAGAAWPPIGPERPLDAATPALQRYASGLYVP